MELGKPLLLRHIRIPHADRAFDIDLPHEQAIDPAKAKLHELDALALQMPRQPAIDPRRQIPQRAHLPHNPRLGKDIIILYTVEELGETPKRIRLDGVQDRSR